MKRVLGPGLALACCIAMVCCGGSDDSNEVVAGSGGADAGADSSAGTAGSAGGTAGASGQGGLAGAAGQAGQAGAAGSAGVAGQAGQGGAAGAAGDAGSGGEAGAAGSAGAGVNPAGCADGTREGFADMLTYQFIAACNGAWDQPGIFDMPPGCNRQAGNDGANAAGVGCTVSDLCAPGWHVCYGRDDVLLRNKEGCLGVMDGATSPVFFTTQMSSTGAFECSTGQNSANDLFGCGDLGCNFSSNPTAQQKCAPLIMSSHDLCKGLRNDGDCGDWCNHLGKYPALDNAWSCGTDTEKEALNVVKSHPDQQGGVLCCMDDNSGTGGAAGSGGASGAGGDAGSSGAGATGGSAGTGGGSSKGGSSGDAGTSCTDLANTGPAPACPTTATVPAPKGGALTPGVYHLTQYQYGGGACASFNIATTIRISALMGDYHQVELASIFSSNADQQTELKKWKPSGTSIEETTICKGAVNIDIPWSYSVVDNGGKPRVILSLGTVYRVFDYVGP